MSSARFFAPEVVQSSAMDCGPATLKCLLEGFGIPVSYGRLREACQTDVDGTSIDTIEAVAQQLGLETEQTVLPLDHLLLPEARALPAIVVVRFANGLTHFVVAWRRHGPLLQLMDPATGRRWTSGKAFLEEAYIHEIPISASSWRQWAEGEEFSGALRRRLSDLRMPVESLNQVIETSRADSTWRSFAALDAVTRMVTTLVQTGGLRRGAEAAGGISAFFQRLVSEPDKATKIVPKLFWSAQGMPPGGGEAEQVLLRGAVIVRVLGRKPQGTETPAGTTADSGARVPPSACKKNEQSDHADDGVRAPELSPELIAALNEPSTSPGRELFRLLRADGLLAPAVLAGGLLLAAGAVILEAILLRGLFDLGRDLTLSGQRFGAMVAIIGFVFVLLLLELPVAGMILRLGRRLETRLRVAFFEKIPRLVDRYFQSRLMSDMAERSHRVEVLRALPDVSARFARACFELLFTAMGIVWLDSRSAIIASVAVLASVALPLLTNPLLMERDLRLRTHMGALSRFYLDALLGLIPIRTHGAERAVRSEHESLLVEWVRAGFGLQRTGVFVEAIQAFTGVGLAVWLLLSYLARHADAGGALLMVYWALNLPVLAEEVALLARQYPSLRSVTLRLLEPLGAPEERTSFPQIEPLSHASPHESPVARHRTPMPPVSICFSEVSVVAGGHTILQDLELRVAPGEHVGIVGPSGAGKSSLVGLLLGWHRPAAGELLADDEPLNAARLQLLRRHIAWVDPAVQLWNRSLLNNLSYGTNGDGAPDIGWVLHQADLLRVLQKLPDGLQTHLGESGGLVSGGEGQRVRLGRALIRQDIRLAILDEPFRGLDREQRRSLMERARAHWQGVTLLCITHDVGDTLSFDRVLVIEGGRLVEDGPPAALSANSQSRYAALLASEHLVRQRLWLGEGWRRQFLDAGRLVETSVKG